MSEYAIHVNHRDDECPPRVLYPFQSREDAATVLDDAGWDRDDRGFDCWHHADDWPYVAVIVAIEGASSLREHRSH
jgi:hypothetical protein